jgi:hypothetical protein
MSTIKEEGNRQPYILRFGYRIMPVEKTRFEIGQKVSTRLSFVKNHGGILVYTNDIKQAETWRIAWDNKREYPVAKKEETKPTKEERKKK